MKKDSKIQNQLRSGGTVKGKEGRNIKKGKREGYEISLRGSDQIAKFATLISLKSCGAAAASAGAFAPAVLASLAPIFEGKILKEEEIEKFKIESNRKPISNFKHFDFEMFEKFVPAQKFRPPFVNGSPEIFGVSEAMLLRAFNAGRFGKMSLFIQDFSMLLKAKKKFQQRLNIDQCVPWIKQHI